MEFQRGAQADSHSPQIPGHAAVSRQSTQATQRRAPSRQQVFAQLKRAYSEEFPELTTSYDNGGYTEPEGFGWMTFSGPSYADIFEILEKKPGISKEVMYNTLNKAGKLRLAWERTGGASGPNDSQKLEGGLKFVEKLMENTKLALRKQGIDLDREASASRHSPAHETPDSGSFAAGGRQDTTAANPPRNAAVRSMQPRNEGKPAGPRLIPAPQSNHSLRASSGKRSTFSKLFSAFSRMGNIGRFGPTLDAHQQSVLGL